MKFVEFNGFANSKAIKQKSTILAAGHLSYSKSGFDKWNGPTIALEGI